MAEDNIYNKSGIYKIVNLVNGKLYIGSATIFRKRRDLHKLELNRNNHHSRHLQHAWNKYGEDNFKFEILEIVENKAKLIEREQFYLDALKPEYNICLKAESRFGIKSTPEHIAKIVIANTGQKRSEETCRKIGLAKKGTVLSEKRKQARRDYRHSEEAKKKISANHRYRNFKLICAPLTIG